ncbi:MAG: class I SAM-dependent methyltransferase [Oscillospiraceae bacterium]|jgi:putative AdoMet-dependent methyltransferase|nr:class I SAM-dependent methyltransferase [Oscillospiraceae bacterium]
MLDNHGFDMWADGYDKSVNISDNENEYPFAGYKKIMNAIYGKVMEKSPAKVLDIGIGTGTLAFKLYEAGNDITGIDFSMEMLNQAKARMLNAKLIQHDFSQGLPCELNEIKFDFIISTYALHHLEDMSKVEFIKALLDNINETGAIIIGDVAFQNRDGLEKCKNACGDSWDDDEFYMVFSELYEKLYDVCVPTYHQYSHCSGILDIRPLHS